MGLPDAPGRYSTQGWRDWCGGHSPGSPQAESMHQAADASFAAMQEQGYDLSILRGRHYVKMGYARAWNYVTYRFKLEDYPVDVPMPAYRLLSLSEVPEMDALYNQAHASFPGDCHSPHVL